MLYIWQILAAYRGTPILQLSGDHVKPSYSWRPIIWTPRGRYIRSNYLMSEKTNGSGKKNVYWRFSDPGAEKSCQCVAAHTSAHEQPNLSISASVVVFCRITGRTTKELRGLKTGPHRWLQSTWCVVIIKARITDWQLQNLLNYVVIRCGIDDTALSAFGESSNLTALRMGTPQPPRSSIASALELIALGGRFGSSVVMSVFRTLETLNSPTTWPLSTCRIMATFLAMVSVVYVCRVSLLGARPSALADRAPLVPLMQIFWDSRVQNKAGLNTKLDMHRIQHKALPRTHTTERWE